MPLPRTLTGSVSSLFIADFNGDGRADIGTWMPLNATTVALKVSYSGAGDWTTLRAFTAASIAAIGRFDADPGSDVLTWHSNYLDIASAGTAASVRQSRQDMN
jgi:hypothetical protein